MSELRFTTLKQHSVVVGLNQPPILRHLGQMTFWRIEHHLTEAGLTINDVVYVNRTHRRAIWRMIIFSAR